MDIDIIFINDQKKGVDWKLGRRRGRPSGLNRINSVIATTTCDEKTTQYGYSIDGHKKARGFRRLGWAIYGLWWEFKLKSPH